MTDKELTLQLLDDQFRRKHKKMQAAKDQGEIKKYLDELEIITKEMKKISEEK